MNQGGSTVFRPMHAIPTLSVRARILASRARLAVLFNVAILLVGGLAGFVYPTEPAVLAHGVCQAVNAGCGPGDGTKTGVLDVRHFKNNGTTEIEPTTGESWEITGHWNPAAGICNGTHETASVDVDWNGTGWTLSNTSLTTNIVGISVCDISGSDCGSTTGKRAYRLLVDVNDPASTTLHLQQVSFVTTSVDNGVEFDMMTPCSVTANTVTPTSQNFAAQDNGGFECGFNCTATGATVTIVYQ
jgi:hypothetical protein